MATSVWCVFQKLPGESCPALAAVCASAEAADALVELSRREQEQMGEAPGEWMIQKWGVLTRDVHDIEDADQISHVMTPLREAIADPRGDSQEESDRSNPAAESVR